MASEAVKVARIERKAQQEKMLFDGVMMILGNDVIKLLSAWVAVEYLQNTRAPWADPDRPTTDPSTHYIGSVAAAALQAAIAAGFGLNGFRESGILDRVFK